jgi:hypothetical protein
LAVCNVVNASSIDEDGRLKLEDTNSLVEGRLVIDLAEFAGIDQIEKRVFAVVCNKQIHEAVGKPILAISIR